MSREDTPATKRVKTNIERYGKDIFSKRAGMTTAAWEKNGKKPRGFAYLKAHDMTGQLSSIARKGGKTKRSKVDRRK